jgi:hypothetical protein
VETIVTLPLLLPAEAVAVDAEHQPPEAPPAELWRLRLVLADVLLGQRHRHQDRGQELVQEYLGLLEVQVLQKWCRAWASLRPWLMLLLTLLEVPQMLRHISCWSTGLF